MKHIVCAILLVAIGASAQTIHGYVLNGNVETIDGIDSEDSCRKMANGYPYVFHDGVCDVRLELKSEATPQIDVKDLQMEMEAIIKILQFHDQDIERLYANQRRPVHPKLKKRSTTMQSATPSPSPAPKP